MESNINQDMSEVMEAKHLQPAVSVIMPVRSKIGLEKELTHALKIAADKIEIQLYDTFSDEVATSVIQRLHRIIAQNNFEKDKKSIVIYVSPVFEKIMYLDVEAEERIIINESFEIRDLVYSKKQLNKYLVLLLSGNESRLYLCDTNTYVKLMLDIPENVYAYMNEVPERVANFSDMTDRKQTVINKFLRHIDDGLDAILKTYKLPLFVLGPEKVLGQFKQSSKHKAAVSEYIHGNYDETTIPELKTILAPHFATWKKEKQQHLMTQLEDAQNKKKLAVGIKGVWREAMQHNGRLLVLEENYMYARQQGDNKNVMNHNSESRKNQPIYTRDAVDEIIEEILKNGGNVAFVEEGVLNNYQQIALILYY